MTDVIQTIDKLVPEFLMSLRSDEKKYRHAVITQECEKLAIATVDSGSTTWRQFTTKRHAAISLCREMEQSDTKKTSHNTLDGVGLLTTYLRDMVVTSDLLENRKTSQVHHLGRRTAIYLHLVGKISIPRYRRMAKAQVCR